MSDQRVNWSCYWHRPVPLVRVDCLPVSKTTTSWGNLVACLPISNMTTSWGKRARCANLDPRESWCRRCPCLWCTSSRQLPFPAAHNTGSHCCCNPTYTALRSGVRPLWHVVTGRTGVNLIPLRPLVLVRPDIKYNIIQRETKQIPLIYHTQISLESSWIRHYIDRCTSRLYTGSYAVCDGEWHPTFPFWRRRWNICIEPWIKHMPSWVEIDFELFQLVPGAELSRVRTCFVCAASSRITRSPSSIWWRSMSSFFTEYSIPFTSSCP